MRIFYATLAMMFIVGELIATWGIEYVKGSAGRHSWPARGRHAEIYRPRLVVGAASHKQRQGALTMAPYRPGMFAAA